jgi:hypothetical protein
VADVQCSTNKAVAVLQCSTNKAVADEKIPMSVLENEFDRKLEL